jgi:hypothetical protein
VVPKVERAEFVNAGVIVSCPRHDLLIALIERILAHVRQRAEDDVSQLPLGARAPPQPSLF